MADRKVGQLLPPQQPRLPAAPVEYAQRYGDDLTNVLRLYFNQLSNVLQEIIVSNQLPFYNQVAQGLVAGYSIVNMSGENPDVDSAAYEDLWYEGGVQPFPAAALQMTVSSSSTSDTSAGTGARTVLIQGVDANYEAISETVTMNGQTAVTTAASFLRVNKMATLTVGTGLVNAGTVYIGTGVVTAGVPATIYNTMPVGLNNSLSFSYTVPAGYTGYLLYSRLTVGQASGTTGTTARLIVTDGVTNNISMITAVANINNGTVPYEPPVPVRIPEKSRVSATAIGAANNNSVGAIAQIMLVQD
jgi:hypothetical protein